MVWCKAVRNSGNILHPKLRLNKIIKVANKCITFSAVSSTKIHAASSRRMPRWLAPLGLDTNLEITALCIYAGAILPGQKKERSSSSLDRCLQKALLIKFMTRKKITWTVAASMTSSANRPGSSPGSLKCGLFIYTGNCSCTTASLSFPCNYRHLLDLARLSDWISSLSNRPEVVSTLRGEGKKGKKGRSAVLEDQGFSSVTMFAKYANQTISYVLF